jgi:hypothetical protein
MRRTIINKKLFIMKKQIENRIGMYRTVITFCEKVTTEMQSIPALWTNYQTFKAKVEELDNMVQLQMKQLEGIAEDKHDSCERMINLLIKVSATLKAYADEIGEKELYRAAHYSISSLRKMRDDAVYEAANIVYNLADAHSANLGPYGFTPVLFTDFGNAIDDYKIKVSEPEEAIKMRKFYTTSISDIDHLIRELLARRIDHGIEVLELSHPSITKKYKNARVIYDRNGRRKESIELISVGKGVFTGVVTDDAGLPVPDALVRIENSTINTYTDSDGEYMMEVPEGTYNIVVWKDGFVESRDSDVDIGAGENVEKDFMLDIASPAAA